MEKLFQQNRHCNLLKNKILIAIVSSFFIFFFCFFKISNQPINEWDELTNLKVIHITSLSDDYLKLESKHFFEKPPLFYYLSILINSIIKLSIKQFRIIPAFFGFLLILILFFKQLQNCLKKAIIFLFCIFSSIQLFFTRNEKIFSTHSLKTFDSDSIQIFFIFFSALTIDLFFKKKKLFLIFISSIFSGFALLTKGPIGILPIIIAIFFQLLKDKTNKKFLMQIFFSFLVSIFIFLTWLTLMTIKFQSNFFNEFVNYHILRRTIEAIENHKESTLFYFYIIFRTDFFALFEILIIAILIEIKEKFKSISKDFFNFFCFTFLLTILFCFSFVQTKLSWYILPFYPAAAIFISEKFEAIENLFEKRWTITLILSLFFTIKTIIFNNTTTALIFLLLLWGIKFLKKVKILQISFFQIYFLSSTFSIILFYLSKA